MRSMRRFLIGLVLVLLLAVSIGIGIVVARWTRL
jgi:ABC-type nitrate/sulfonate/bicarbonate transport system permease component